MASIYIYNLKTGRSLELSSPAIQEEDIEKLRKALPKNLEGIAFSAPEEQYPEIQDLRSEHLEPRIAAYLQNIGQKLDLLKQSAGALYCYDLALRLGRNPQSLLSKAKALSQLGQIERSERLLQNYLEIYPQSSAPYFYLGKHALSCSNYAAALGHFSEARQRLASESDPALPGLEALLTAYIKFAEIYLKRDRLFSLDLEAEAYASSVVQLRGETADLLRNIRALEPKLFHELEAMAFSLEAQDKIFEKWLEEMQGHGGAGDVQS